MKNTLVLALVLVASQLAEAVPNSNSIIDNDIEYYFQTDKAVYDLGKNVEMLYRVTNLRDTDVTFEFVEQQQCFFEVWDTDTRIWGWPKLVNPAGSIFTLQPGGFKNYLIDWDMINDSTGVLVVPGNYDASGGLSGIGSDGTIPESVSVSIQIVPEPSTFLLLGSGLLSFFTRNRTNLKR